MDYYLEFYVTMHRKCGQIPHKFASFPRVFIASIIIGKHTSHFGSLQFQNSLMEASLGSILFLPYSPPFEFELHANDPMQF